jgi:hypothetical protein
MSSREHRHTGMAEQRKRHGDACAAQSNTLSNPFHRA